MAGEGLNLIWSGRAEVERSGGACRFGFAGRPAQPDLRYMRGLSNCIHEARRVHRELRRWLSRQFLLDFGDHFFHLGIAHFAIAAGLLCAFEHAQGLFIMRAVEIDAVEKGDVPVAEIALAAVPAGETPT